MRRIARRAERSPKFPELDKVLDESVSAEREYASDIHITKDSDGIFMAVPKSSWVGSKTHVSLRSAKNTSHTHWQPYLTMNDCSIQEPSANDMKIYSRDCETHEVSSVSGKRWFVTQCKTSKPPQGLGELVFTYFNILQDRFDNVSGEDKIEKYSAAWGAACNHLNLFEVYVFDTST